MAEVVMQASTFKARCLALLDEVARSRSTIVVTKHGKPIAELVPINDEPALTRGSSPSSSRMTKRISPPGNPGMPSAESVLVDTHPLLSSPISTATRLTASAPLVLADETGGGGMQFARLVPSSCAYTEGGNETADREHP